MNEPKLKLSLNKETLRPLEDKDLEVLDSVVGGTCIITCGRTISDIIDILT